MHTASNSERNIIHWVSSVISRPTALALASSTGTPFETCPPSDQLQFFRPVMPESWRMRPAIKLVKLDRSLRELGDHFQFAPQGLHDSPQRGNLHIVLVFELGQAWLLDPERRGKLSLTLTP